MGKASIYALALLCALDKTAFAEGRDDVVVLYQLGRNGNYCVSISPSDKGCVSGSKDNADPINILNIIRNKTVVFRNLSDAPHDMRISGANSEDMPAQAPNGADAQKKMAVEDPNKEKITCSFHGNQLAVGYKVMGKPDNADQGAGHKTGGEGNGSNAPTQVAGAGGGGGSGDLGKMTPTGLSDVSKQVLAKGRPAEVTNLVNARPELMGQLKQIRPLLAQELTAKGAGGMDGFGYAGGGKAPGVAVAGGPGAPGGAGGGSLAKAGAVASAKGGAGGGAGGGGGGSGGGADGGGGIDGLDDLGGGAGGPGGKKPVLVANGGLTVETAVAQSAKGSSAATTAQKAVAARTASAADIPDRIKMRRPAKQVARSAGLPTYDWHKWLILALAVTAGSVGFMVFTGTRSKKKKKAA